MSRFLPPRSDLRRLVASMVIAEAVRTIGQIPSGHLYAMLVGKLELNDYQAALETLKGAGLVAERGNVLTWVGPEVTQ